MSKYQPLHDYLTHLPTTTADVTLRFDEVEHILGERLPASASQHRPWWANPTNKRDHPYAQAWLAAGWRVDAVDLTRRWVRFRRSGLGAG